MKRRLGELRVNVNVLILTIHLCSGLHQKRRQEVCSRDSKLSSNALRQPRKYLIQANDDMP